MKYYKTYFKKTIEKLYKNYYHFLKVFSHGTLSEELYEPDSLDLQKQHTQDEIYSIASSKGEFLNNGNGSTFKTGGFPFVYVYQEQRLKIFQIILQLGFYSIVQKVVKKK